MTKSYIDKSWYTVNAFMPLPLRARIWGAVAMIKDVPCCCELDHYDLVTRLAYTTCGRKGVLYAVALMVVLLIFSVRFRIDRVWFVFRVMLSVCLFTNSNRFYFICNEVKMGHAFYWIGTLINVYYMSFNTSNNKKILLVTRIFHYTLRQYWYLITGS